MRKPLRRKFYPLSVCFVLSLAVVFIYKLALRERCDQLKCCHLRRVVRESTIPYIALQLDCTCFNLSARYLLGLILTRSKWFCDRCDAALNATWSRSDPPVSKESIEAIRVQLSRKQKGRRNVLFPLL